MSVFLSLFFSGTYRCQGAPSEAGAPVLIQCQRAYALFRGADERGWIKQFQSGGPRGLRGVTKEVRQLLHVAPNLRQRSSKLSEAWRAFRHSWLCKPASSSLIVLFFFTFPRKDPSEIRKLCRGRTMSAIEREGGKSYGNEIRKVSNNAKEKRVKMTNDAPTRSVLPLPAAARALK